MMFLGVGVCLSLVTAVKVQIAICLTSSEADHFNRYILGPK